MAEKSSPKTGAEAITSAKPTPPYAVPRLVRTESGLMTTIYVNPETGEQIPNLNGYTIISGNNYYQPDEVDDENKDGVVESDEITQTNTAKALEQNKGGALESNGPTQGGPGNQNAANNYGYKSKPGFVGLAGMVPGPIGLAGKAVNLGWNANNLSATSTARAMLGLPDLTAGQTVKGLARDQKGQVGKVDINGNTYSVGFEAMSPSGKTNLTPAEARQRALTLGGLTENTSKDTKKESKGAHILSRLFGVDPDAKTEDKHILGNIFGVTRDEDASTPTPTSRTTQTQSQPSALMSPNRPSTPSAPTTTDPTGVGFQAAFGPNRPNMPSDNITGAIKGAVAQTFGPGYSIKGISGTEDEGKQYGSKRHKTGLALDFDVVDPSGRKVTDQNKLSDLASNFAFANPTAQVGYGLGYMTDEKGLPGRLHFDLTDLGETDPQHYSSQWGSIASGAALKSTLDAARAGFQPTPFSNAPTPTARPDPTAPRAFVSQDERPSTLDPVGDSLDPIGTSSIRDKNQPTVARQTIANAVNTPTQAPARPDFNSMTPAQAASLGITTRTPEQVSQIARTIAGELSPSALKSLAAGDEDAKAEFASMISSIENRSTSKMFSTLDSALNPTSYNSLMDSNAAVTNQNFEKFSQALMDNANAFYSGKLAPPSWGVTSYYNPDVVDPTWGSLMSDPTQIGAHIFGSLPEYGANNAFKDTMKSKQNYADLGTPNDGVNSSTTGLGTGSAIGGTPGQSGAAGFTPGGMNSPSGSSYGGLGGANPSHGSALGFGGIGSDRGSSSRAGLGTTGLGQGGIGSDRGSASRSGGSSIGSSVGGGGIGSDRGSASRAGSSSSSSGSKGTQGGLGGGGIGSDHGASAGNSNSGKSSKDKGSGQGGIGHA